MAAPFALPSTLLQGRRIVVLGSASGLGRAVAQATEAAGAEVLGVDGAAVFDHLAALYCADLSDPAALDAVAAALPDGIDGLALFPALKGPAPAPTLAQGLLAPRHLADALAHKMAPNGAIVARAAPPHAAWATSLAQVRAAAALRWEDLDGFVARWGLDVEPTLAPRLTGWGMLAWVMANRWAWSAQGLRVNALTPASPDGHLPPPVSIHTTAEGADIAARAAVFLLSGLSQGLTGANLAADGGLSAQIQTRLEGL